MKIALDFDETYTKDPQFWDTVIDLAEMRGHEIMVVTFRDSGIPIEADPSIPVYYTSYRSKRRHMKSLGIEIDVWIDDSPETIVADSSWSNEELERWKDNNEAISNRVSTESSGS